MQGKKVDYPIVLKNVKKAFGNNVVLDDLNLEVPRGKISFIIGRSGEGKSVTIKHVVGILHPDSGEIYVNGIDMTHALPKTWENARKEIGILFQEGALFDSLNVFENVSFPLSNHLKMSNGDLKKEVENLLELVGLPGIEKKYPAELSMGEKKRVGLARALALKPNLLLYDEPTTGMDPLVSDFIDALIKSTQQKMHGITSVVISHDITSIMNVAEHIFLLHQGKIYFHGTPEDFRNSDDVLVKQFLTGSKNGPLEVPLV
jgi:phospholipid/cholesterol/gamma-HCH transport system ATP-binding protein